MEEIGVVSNYLGGREWYSFLLFGADTKTNINL
jgi:hypothetical protein